MKRTRASLATIVLAGLALSGCAATDATDANGSGDSAPIVVAMQKPTSLIPGNARGSWANTVAATLFSGLVDYDRETGEPQMLVADSIESDDQTVWTITLQDGWTFHNGEPVDAASFARGWNATANPANAWLGSPNFSIFEGYDAVAPTEGEPTATELSGIRVVDDLTLEVTLSSPNSQFPYLLGQPAFFPMAEAALEDLDAYATQPIGNGPYEMTSPWTGGEEITTTRYDDYGGEVAENSGVTFRIYTGFDVAYRDYQAGEVDATSLLATDAASAKSAYADYFFTSPVSAVFSYLSVPTYADGYSDPRIRHALSMAIDREQIIETLFAGDETYAPMTDIGVPASVGYRDDACEEYCSYDPAAAKALWDEAGGLPSLKLTVVSGTGRDAYSEAIINMWQENLGVEVEMDFVPSENTHGALLGQEIQNPTSLGRASNYPSPEAILTSSFRTGAPSNYSFYSSAEYDAALAAALAAPPAESEALFDAAKDILIEDMPVIPLWTTGTSWVVSERLAGDFAVDPFNASPYSTFSVG